VNADMFEYGGGSVEAFFILRNMFLDGNKWQSSHTGTGRLDAWHRVTGAGAGNTDGGALHGTIVDLGGGSYRADLYKDAAKTQQVGHTADYSATGLAALNADNASGLGGYVGVKTLGADTDFDVTGNYAGGCLTANENLWDSTVRDVMLMNFQGEGFTIGTVWGWLFHNVVIEFCGGTGIKITAYHYTGHITDCKIIDNDGHGIEVFSSGLVVKGNQLQGGDDSLSESSEGKFGLFLNGASDCTINGNKFSIGSNNGGEILTALNAGNKANNNSINGNVFGSPGTFTGSVGILLAYQGGRYNQIGGNLFDRHAIGVKVLDPYNSIVGNAFNGLAKGVQLLQESGVSSGGQTTVNGNTFYTGAVGVECNAPNCNISGNNFQAPTAIGLDMQTAGASCVIDGNTFLYGPTQLKVRSYGHVITGNQFRSPGTYAVDDTGTKNLYMGNRGFDTHRAFLWEGVGSDAADLEIAHGLAANPSSYLEKIAVATAANAATDEVNFYVKSMDATNVTLTISAGTWASGVTYAFNIVARYEAAP